MADFLWSTSNQHLHGLPTDNRRVRLVQGREARAGVDGGADGDSLTGGGH